MTTHDSIGEKLKNTALLPMPAGLEARIMARIEAEINEAEMNKTSVKRPLFAGGGFKIAAAVALLAVATTVALKMQPGNVPDTVAKNEPTIEDSIAAPPDEAPEITVANAPGLETHEPAVADNTDDSTNDRVTVAEQDVMAISQVNAGTASLSPSLNDIGADPLADASVADDPVMMLIGF